jgi:hypothetical protein
VSESNGPVAVEALIERADRAHEQVCIAQREFFGLVADMDRIEAWAEHGARDMAHWLWMRYGVSDWKARRWIACAHALESLPLISQAFSSGVIGADKIVELTRFATPSTEKRLLEWAERVSPFAIRRRGDMLLRREAMEAAAVDRDRFLRWSFIDDGRRLALEGELPAADGAVVCRALDRIASTLPELPGEEALAFADARRADALRALCGAHIAADADPDRATVIVHASVDALAGDADASGTPGRCRDRRRPGAAPGGRAQARVHRARASDRTGCLRRSAAHGQDDEGALHGAASGGAPPRRRVRLPRLRGTALHRGPSRGVVEPGRPDRHRQPGAHLRDPPPPGA